MSEGGFQAERRGGWNAEASNLALFRWLLPHRERRSADGTFECVPASTPGQNAWEAYGFAVAALLFHTSFFAETLSRVASTGVIVSWAAGFWLGFLWLHVLAVLAGAAGTFLRCRWKIGLHERWNVFAHRVCLAFSYVLALWALRHGYPITTPLAALWLGFAILDTWAWFALRRWWRLGLFALAHWFALLLWVLVAWKIGLSVLALAHLVMLWGALRPGSRVYGPVIRRITAAQKAVVLTIDDGPSPLDTAALLEMLDRFQAKAIFFVIGERATEHPELLREIVHRGHQIGNHSRTHRQGWFWALPWWCLRREIDATQSAIEAITGVKPRWFRSPVGFGNPFLHPLLERRQLCLMGWDARGFDGIGRRPQAILNSLKASVRSGSIVLLHQGRKHSVEITENLLTWLQGQGFRTVLPNKVLKSSATHRCL